MTTTWDLRFKMSWCSGATYVENKEQLQKFAAAVQMETETSTHYHSQKMKTKCIDLFLGSPENILQNSEVEKEV